MSKDKGIFEPKEGFASEKPGNNPFEFQDKSSNPFAAGHSDKSPFASTDAPAPPPLRSADVPSGSSFPSGESRSPFGEVPSGSSYADSNEDGDSPFAILEDAEPAAPKVSGPPPLAESPAAPAAPAPESKPVAAAAPAPVASTPASSGFADSSFSEGDSAGIRQLELRAIFGVDRELSESEMLERSRKLPGIRELARVSSSDIGAVDALKRLVGGLNFGGGAVRLTCGDKPIEFIREGSVLLAVQNDGSFAPGVRETLMIVARELGRM